MKRIISAILILGVILMLSTVAFGALTGQEGHNKYIYPVVRVSDAYVSGSGTVIYSFHMVGEKGLVSYSTYVLTNYHVIEGAITISEEWDTDLQKNVKKEKRSIVYVEIFKYRDISTPIGTLKVEADIVLYNKDFDVALLKLRTEEVVPNVADLPNKENVDNLLVMDESIAVGCSLGFPPLPTLGVITRKNFQINSLSYHMSSSQIIYGNSGGAMFNGRGELIGIPSMVAVAGWSTPITHMGLFIPIVRIYEWLEAEHYDFIFDLSLKEQECLEKRETEIEAKKKVKGE